MPLLAQASLTWLKKAQQRKMALALLKSICRCPVTTINVITKLISSLFRLLLAYILRTVHKLAVCILCVPLLAKALLDKLFSCIAGKVTSVRLWVGQLCSLSRLKECLLWLPRKVEDCLSTSSHAASQLLKSRASALSSCLDPLKQCFLWIPLRLGAFIGMVLARIASLAGSIRDETLTFLGKERKASSRLNLLKACLLWLPFKVKDLIGKFIALVFNLVGSIRGWQRDNEVSTGGSPCTVHV